MFPSYGAMFLTPSSLVNSRSELGTPQTPFLGGGLLLVELLPLLDLVTAVLDEIDAVLTFSRVLLVEAGFFSQLFVLFEELFDPCTGQLPSEDHRFIRVLQVDVGAARAEIGNREVGEGLLNSKPRRFSRRCRF